jgi:DNA-binding NtrC family response regulator
MFPAVQSTGLEAVIATAPASASFVANENAGTILLTEDESGVRGYVRHILERNGYRVAEASNGLEAADVIHRYPGPIHLLLTDVVMPEVGGVELAAQFAAAYPGVPILYMSGYNDKLWLRDDMAVNFIQKPFSSAALLARIRELLDAHRQVGETRSGAV